MFTSAWPLPMVFSTVSCSDAVRGPIVASALRAGSSGPAWTVGPWVLVEGRLLGGPEALSAFRGKGGCKHHLFSRHWSWWPFSSAPLMPNGCERPFAVSPIYTHFFANKNRSLPFMGLPPRTALCLRCFGICQCSLSALSVFSLSLLPTRQEPYRR